MTISRQNAVAAIQTINRQVGEGSHMNLSYRCLEIIRLGFAGIKNSDEDPEWDRFTKDKAESLEPYTKYNPGSKAFDPAAPEYNGGKFKPFVFTKWTSLTREFALLSSYFKAQAEELESKVLRLCADYAEILSDAELDSASEAYKKVSAAYRKYAAVGQSRGPRGTISQQGFESRLIDIADKIAELGGSGFMPDYEVTLDFVLVHAGVDREKLAEFRLAAEKRREERSSKKESE